MESAVACAGINIGYGHLKLSTPDNLFVTASVVAPSNPLYDGVGRRRETHKVRYQDMEYEVGADAMLLTRTPETARMPIPQWAGTHRYQVLAQLIKDRLALESGAWHITIGLPIADYQDAAYRKRVKAFWQGQQQTANGPVEIVTATVVPEPIGALFTYLQDFPDGALQQESQTSHLVIDIGFFTTDWLALSRLSPDMEQSQGIDIGMHAILSRMAQKIAVDFQKNGTSDLISLETLLLEQIHSGKPGKVDLPAYAQQAAAEMLPALIDQIQSATYRWMRSDDEKKILLAGGAAPLLLPAIARAFPIPVSILPDSQTANALGYRLQCAMRQQDSQQSF